MRKKTYFDEAREKESAQINQYCIRYLPCAVYTLVGISVSEGLGFIQVIPVLLGFFIVVELSYYGIDRDGYLASFSSWLAWAVFGYLWYVDQFSNMLLAALVPATVLFVVMRPFIYFRTRKERRDQW